MPLVKAMGRKTATMVEVTASTASAISAAPLRAAVLGSSPFSMWRKMFSRTTMASSISIPTERERAIMEIMLSEMPRAFSTMKVPSTTTGSPATVTRVLRKSRKKSSTTSAARMPPISSVSWTSLMASFVKVD